MFNLHVSTSKKRSNVLVIERSKKKGLNNLDPQNFHSKTTLSRKLWKGWLVLKKNIQNFKGPEQLNTQYREDLMVTQQPLFIGPQTWN